jgi:hypothetical protein
MSESEATAVESERGWDVVYTSGAVLASVQDQCRGVALDRPAQRRSVVHLTAMGLS